MATKEEELQKKREEAERKARRGEIDPTHEFTFQVYPSIIFIIHFLALFFLENIYKELSQVEF
jgi:hypothetical protein